MRDHIHPHSYSGCGTPIPQHEIPIPSMPSHPSRIKDALPLPPDQTSKKETPKPKTCLYPNKQSSKLPYLALPTRTRTPPQPPRFLHANWTRFFGFFLFFRVQLKPE
ncbi:hypothetical protein B0T16DRAFT_234053 [Cercophora newfieldiana]|uniref:Uncharacterized protein n=1 Tax=Cercophora newfieldiana TaxID=92897 RepID=A0AA39XRH7_9PEZI|nr:hypothetical protein B0T16DRAFT_234053 [Cercophora newfieldiana]